MCVCVAITLNLISHFYFCCKVIFVHNLAVTKDESFVAENPGK